MLLILLVNCVVGFCLFGRGGSMLLILLFNCVVVFLGGRGSILLILVVFCVVFFVLFGFVLCIVPNVSCVS